MTNSPRQFLLALAVTLGLGAATIATIDIVIDPLWRFDLVTLHGINDQRPVLPVYARSGKAGIVCRLQPTQIAMGTSRVEVGIDPKHPGWESVPGPVYNLGLSGIGLKELSLTFQHAVNTSPLKRAVIGLDFLMFNANREAVVFGTEVFDFDEAQLVLSRFDGCWRTLLFNAWNLLGYRGLALSYLTITHQLAPSDENDPNKAASWESLYDKDGFRSYFHFGVPPVHKVGVRTIFGGQENYYVKKVWRPMPDQRYCFARPGQPNTLDVFRDMVRFARRSGVDVRFYLEPLHARMMLALQDAGLWPQFEDWKRGVVAVLAEDAQESGKPQFPLWDFSGFNTVTNEHVPDAADRTTSLRWFWEASHYKKETGDLILDRVLDYHAPGHPDPADFGVGLSPDNVESWLAATRQAGRDYVRAEPEEAHIVKAEVDRALSGASGSNCGDYMDVLRTASEALRHGDRQGAAAAFERAKAIDQSDRQRAADMGVSYREPGFAIALQIAEAGGRLPPSLDTWEAYQDRGIQREDAGDHLGAAMDLAQAIRIGPPNPALHYVRGVALLHAGDSQGAIGEFEAALKLDPNNAGLRGLLNSTRENWVTYQESGIRKDAAGDYRGAAEDFAHAIRVGPPNPALHFLRGVTLLHAEDPQGAALEFEAGLKLDPDNSTLRGLLAQAQQAVRATAIPAQSAPAAAAVSRQQ